MDMIGTDRFHETGKRVEHRSQGTVLQAVSPEVAEGAVTQLDNLHRHFFQVLRRVLAPLAVRWLHESSIRSTRPPGCKQSQAYAP
jgi:hypothetical protein